MVKINHFNKILAQIPNCIFWKDINSVFLGANLNFVQAAGFDCIEDLIGKTDFDMPWGETHADLYRARDYITINDKIPTKQIETQLRTNGKLVTVVVNKAPLFDDKRNIIGIVGSFIELPNSFAMGNNSISLPASQHIVLIQVAQGLSAKEIANNLNLSRRTIEYYIDILKKKLSCRSKSELTMKAWQLGLMSHSIP